MPNAHAAINELIKASEAPALSPPEFETLARRTMIAVESSAVRDSIKDATIEYVQGINAARQRLAFILNSGRFDYLSAHVEGRPGLGEAMNQLIALRKALRDITVFFSSSSRLAPDGYSASDLMREAEISGDLYRQILAESGLQQTKRGNSQRRFSNADIRKLIDAARSYGKRKGKQAASAWERLLQENNLVPNPS